jgi:uncharacterized membrane protein
MGKLEYLDALKRAMMGLAPELQAKTLAYYEQRFVDGVGAGRTEADISKELDDPKKVAMTLRASTHLAAFEKTRNPVNFVRLAMSVLGLAIFNLFMVVPAAVYAALLTAVYACALALYIAGIAITASGLAGANELVLDGPLRHIVIGDDDESASGERTKITIDEMGVRVRQEKVPEKVEEGAANADDQNVDPDAEPDVTAPVLKRAEAVAGHGVHISTDLDAGSRTTQTVFGLSMVIGAIFLFMLCMVVTKYTIIGIKRYIEMNFSLLKGR